jgi:hypothetical protein
MRIARRRVVRPRAVRRFAPRVNAIGTVLKAASIIVTISARTGRA